MLTVMSLNLLMGGEERLPGLVDLVRDRAPDVLMLQEANGWADPGDQRLRDLEQDLGMRGRIAPSQTGFHTGILTTEEIEWVEWREKYAHATFHGFSELVVTVPGLPEPVVLLSAHLNPWSADAAAIEAQLLAGRAHKEAADRFAGGLGILAGDINHVPLNDPEPPWDLVTPADRASRTIASETPLRANRIVGQVLARGELVDAAAHLAEAGDEPELRAPTGHDGQLRGDQIHITWGLLPALVDYRRITTWVDDVELSDHDAVVAVLDLSRLSA